MEQLLKYLELTYYIFAILGFASIIWSFFTLVVSRKQLHFTVISRCIDIFRRDFSDLPLSSDEKNCLKFIDFINEELFYFHLKYIPDSVALEWIDGMINYLPVYHNGNVINSDGCLIKILENNLLINYPRVKKSFEIKSTYNFKLIFSNDSVRSENYNIERKRLVLEILNNSK